jgi:hypothetical protein
VTDQPALLATALAASRAQQIQQRHPRRVAESAARGAGSQASCGSATIRRTTGRPPRRPAPIDGHRVATCRRLR